jgi:hypothetical protein
MQNPQITHVFMRKLTANIRGAYGKEVSHTKVLELVSDALGWKAGALMHSLKQLENQADVELSPPIVCPSWITKHEIPDLDELGCFDPWSLAGLNSLGGQKSGLVLVSGLTATGKTVAANALVKQWVKDNGKLAYMTGEDAEYYLGGKHGNGFIIQKSANHRMPFVNSATDMTAADPAYVLFQDHLHSGLRGHPLVMPLVDNLLEALRLSRERIVVISACSANSATFLSEMAAALKSRTNCSKESAIASITETVVATVDVYRRSDGRQSKFLADVVFPKGL